MNIKYHFDDDRLYMRDWNIHIHIQFAIGHKINNNGQIIRNAQRENWRSKVVESNVVFDEFIEALLVNAII